MTAQPFRRDEFTCQDGAVDNADRVVASPFLENFGFIVGITTGHDHFDDHICLPSCLLHAFDRDRGKRAGGNFVEHQTDDACARGLWWAAGTAGTVAEFLDGFHDALPRFAADAHIL